MMAGKSMTTDCQDVHKMPQIYYRKQLKGFANAIEPTPMQESWIENIIEVCKFNIQVVSNLFLNFLKRYRPTLLFKYITRNQRQCVGKKLKCRRV